MALHLDLGQKAQDLYQWKLSFAGELVNLAPLSQVEVREWITPVSGLQLALASQPLEGRNTYGFVDPNSPAIYHPLATIYSEREQDFQEDLIRAALLHLLKIKPITPRIRFPEDLSKQVRSYHLFLLNRDNREVNEFPGGIVPVYRHGDQASISKVLEGCRIPTNPRD